MEKGLSVKSIYLSVVNNDFYYIINKIKGNKIDYTAWPFKYPIGGPRGTVEFKDSDYNDFYAQCEPISKRALTAIQNIQSKSENNLDELELKLEEELKEAETKAIDSLARYKFAMFGYWAGIWVHLNRVGDFKKPNPFKDLVKLAKEMTK